MRFVIPDLRAIIPAFAVRVFLKLALLLIFIGALHAAGLALTCPLRAPCVHLNFKLCPALVRLYALFVTSDTIIVYLNSLI